MAAIAGTVVSSPLFHQHRTVSFPPHRSILQHPRRHALLLVGFRPHHLHSAASSTVATSGDDGLRGWVDGTGRARMGIDLLRSVMPGGSWWQLEGRGRDVGEKERGDKSRGVTLRDALGRMWRLMGRDRWILFVGIAALIVAAISDISMPNFLTASIFSAQKGEAMLFKRNIRLLIALCCTSGICSGVRGCCFGIANMILVKRLREELYSSLLSQDISFFDSKTVGELTSRLGSDCQQISRIIANDLNLISRDLLQGIGALIFLSILSWHLAITTLAICLALSTITTVYARYQKFAAKVTQDCAAGVTEVAQETFSLIRTVRVYGTEKKENARHLKWLQKMADISLRQTFAYGLWSSNFNFLFHSTQVAAILVGGLSIMSGHITAEQLTKYVMYCEWLLYCTWRLADTSSTMMQALGASEKVFQMLDLLPSKQFLEEGLVPKKLVRHIDFVDISFSYPSRMVSALRQVNLSIFPGEVLAIVGLSGSGKSTLVNLLLGLYKCTSGQILIDGHDIDELDIKWLRERIGYVGQEPRLFCMTVGSNIRYGCTRKITHQDVESAAKQAFAHEFIMSLPHGYETLVDDKVLSGGQKQRIAIARALLRDPTVLILDEATSALDAESEFYVKRIMRAVQSGSEVQRTVIVIAHRLSTIQEADRIVVMDDGKIVEMGNHLELLSKDGLYTRLTKRQADVLS